MRAKVSSGTDSVSAELFWSSSLESQADAEKESITAKKAAKIIDEIFIWGFSYFISNISGEHYVLCHHRRTHFMCPLLVQIILVKFRNNEHFACFTVHSPVIKL